MHLFSRHRIKIKLIHRRKEGFDGWVKCSGCHELLHQSEVEKNLQCCPKCDHHFRFSVKERIALIADEGSFQERFTEFKSADPLEFVDTAPYAERLKEAVAKTGRDEAAIVGSCRIKGREVALGALDFSFMGGSMGSVVGERITCIIEYATEHHLPLILVSASGGARMQEAILSLMQMAKTSAALARHRAERLLYLSVLTHPTTGGVTASFASLGDIILAEPGALIAFAGPRVVEQTIRQKLPPGAQRSEFLLQKGMIDCIVSRHELKEKLFFFIEYLARSVNRPVDLLKEMLALADEEGALAEEVIYGQH